MAIFSARTLDSRRQNAPDLTQTTVLTPRRSAKLRPSPVPLPGPNSIQFTDEWLVPTIEPLLPDQAIAALRQEQAPAPVSLWETVVQRRMTNDEQILAAIATRFRFPVAWSANRLEADAVEELPKETQLASGPPR